MEQQHQNYEYNNETFGFISPYAGSENFEENQKAMPSLIEGFTSTVTNAEYTEPPPLYDHLSASSTIQYQDITSTELKADQKTSNDDVEEVKILNNEDEDKETKSIPEEVTNKEEAGTSKSILMKKKRKRILLNDDEDSDDASDLKKDVLNDSEEKSQEVGGDDADVESNENDDEDITVTNPEALKARFLLKSAVIIEDPDKKKKKKKQRVLDSDDENDHLTTSVDDIGLLNENENEEEEPLIGDNIIILNELDFKPIEEEEEEKSENPPTCEENKSKKAKVETDNCDSQTKNEQPKQNADTEDSEKQPEASIKSDKDTVADKPEEGDETVEEILEKIQPMADDDEFFKFDKSSDENEKAVPNNEYFGTPDKFSTSTRGRKRGPKPGSRRNRNSSRDSPPIRRKRGDRYEKDFVADSDSDSDSSYSDSISSSSSSSSGSSSEEETTKQARPRGRPPVKKSPIQQQQQQHHQYPVFAQRPSITITKFPVKKPTAVKDRFFDQSRNIPDSIYFGDVKVPLHVLHTRWNVPTENPNNRRSQQTSSSSSSLKRNIINIPAKVHHQPIKIRQDYEQQEDPKLSTLKEFVKIVGLKINYGKLFDGIRSTDHKCTIIRKILAQKGLEGEPTVAKCKILKRELQAKRESAELDKSVILSNEGRTRRSLRRGNNTTTTYNLDDSDEVKETKSTCPDLQPEVQKVLSKIKSVIDSDSE